MLIKTGQRDNKVVLIKYEYERNDNLEGKIDLYINGIKHDIKKDYTGYYFDFQPERKYEVILKFKVKLKKCNSLFKYNENLISVDLSLFDSSEITDMNEMFCECKNLEFVNFSLFNSYNVSDMGGLFYDCINLKEIK